MNPSDGMSREELDLWADLFYQAKVCDVTTASFSEFISNPFTHLSTSPQKPNKNPSRAAHLSLVPSNPTTKNAGP
jgi:hypothetical protein